MWIRTFGSGTLLALSLALLPACTAHKEEAGEWLSIGVQACSPATKTTMTDDGSDTEFRFSTGDVMGFFADGVLNNKPLSCTDGGSGSFSGRILVQGAQTLTRPSMDYYAYYPYFKTAGTDPSALTATLPSTQRAPFDGQADFLVADPVKDKYDVDDFPVLNFEFSTHLFAVVKLNVTNTNDAYAGEKILSIGLKSIDTPLAGQFTFSAVDGDVAFSDDPNYLSNQVLVEYATPPTLGKGVTHTVYAVVNAASYASGSLSLVVNTTNNIFTVSSREVISPKSYQMTALGTVDVASASRRKRVRTIILWGDSIFCNGNYHNWLRSRLGANWKVVVGAVGGDSAKSVAARQGALPVFTENAPITLPADTETWVDIDNLYTRLDTDGEDTYSKIISYQTFGTYSQISPVLINGIECVVANGADAYHYHMRRLEAGEEVIIPARSNVQTYGAKTYADADVVVCYSGTNGRSTADYLINLYDKMVSVLTNPDVVFIVLGYHQNTKKYPYYWSEDYVTRMTNYYGRHFIDLRTEGNAQAISLMKTIGQITDESEISAVDLEYIEEGNWPYSWQSSSTDGIHHSKYGARAMGELLYQRMVELDLL